MSAIAPARTLLRYHGGKWVLAPWIISNMAAHRVYVEPYGGGASVLLRKQRSYAEVYNDLDDEVVNLFEVLRSPAAEKLIEALQLTPYAKTEFRNAFQVTGNPVERARRTVVKSLMGFGSWAPAQITPGTTGFRGDANRTGGTSCSDFAKYPETLALVIERLRGVIICNADAWSILKRYDTKDTLAFVDPPYLEETRDAGADYAHEMTVADHETLLTNIKTLEGMVILSGYPSDLYEDYLGDWHRIERTAFANGARKRTEVLWMNFERQKDLLGQ